MNVITWISILVAVGAVIAALAHTRGRSFMRWWIYGSLLGFVALPHLLLARDLSSERRWSPVRYGLPAHDHACPFCGMPVREAALVCRHCRRAVDPEIRRSGWPPPGKSAAIAGMTYTTRYPAHGSPATGGTGVAAGWSMAEYSGFSPVSMSAGSVGSNHEHRGRAAAMPDEPYPTSGEHGAGRGAGVAAGSSQTTTGQTTTGQTTARADERASGDTPTPPDAANPATARAATPTTAPAGAGRSDGSYAPRQRAFAQRRRDSGTILRPVAIAAIAVFITAGLFVIPDRQLVADIVRFVSSAPADRSGMAGDVREEGMPDLSPSVRSDAPSTPPGPTPDVTAGDPASKEAVADVAAPPHPAGKASSSGALPGAQQKPAPGASPAAEPMARSEVAEPAYATAAPKVRPQTGLDAEAQASFDTVIERLKRQVAASATSPGRRETGRASISASGEVVYVLQQKLRARGFDPGGIDGQFGPQTRRALKAFQRDAGMPATGEINRQVLIAFGLIS